MVVTYTKPVPCSAKCGFGPFLIRWRKALYCTERESHAVARTHPRQRKNLKGLVETKRSTRQSVPHCKFALRLLHANHGREFPLEPCCHVRKARGHSVRWLHLCTTTGCIPLCTCASTVAQQCPELLYTFSSCSFTAAKQMVLLNIKICPSLYLQRMRLVHVDVVCCVSKCLKCSYRYRGSDLNIQSGFHS